MRVTSAGGPTTATRSNDAAGCSTQEHTPTLKVVVDPQIGSNYGPGAGAMTVQRVGPASKARAGHQEREGDRAAEGAADKIAAVRAALAAGASARWQGWSGWGTAPFTTSRERCARITCPLALPNRGRQARALNPPASPHRHPRPHRRLPTPRCTGRNGPDATRARPHGHLQWGVCLGRRLPITRPKQDASRWYPRTGA
jgi:hypothetical protein